MSTYLWKSPKDCVVGEKAGCLSRFHNLKFNVLLVRR
jgi:hypothetical protein